MAGVNLKIGVTGVSQFKQDMTSANQHIKTMNADLALLEKQFKNTGDEESYMKTKTELLQAKLEAQKTVLNNAEAALKTMKDNGVSPAAAAFQEMQRKVIAAKGDLIDTETQLKNVGIQGESAKSGVEGLNGQLKEVGKGVSWENVTNGLRDLNRELENGARAAINLGKKILNSAKGSTEYADDLLTMSTKYGVDVETLQRMEKVSEYIDTDVDTILNSKARLAKSKGDLPELLGFEADGMTLDEAFWKAGEAIMAMTDEWEREEAAQKVFGRGWKELVPLFTAGQQEYNEALAEQNVLTEDQVKKLGQADDAIKSVEQQVELLKNQFWAENADKITELMQWIVDNKDAVVTALGAIGAAFGLMKLAEAAANIGKIVNGFQTLWNGAGNALPSVPGASAGGAGAGAGGGVAAAVKSALTTGGGLSMLTPAAVLALGLTPAILANNYDRGNAAAKQASRVMNARNLGVDDSWFLEASANALGIQNDNRWGNYAEIEALLMGMNSRSDMQKAQLYNMLQGRTANGNYTWNELQRLWGGEEMDIGQLTAILESVTEAYDYMAQQAEASEEASDKASDEITNAAKDMSKLPGETADAVRNALNGATVVIDGAALTGVVGGLMAQYVANN